MQASLRLHRSVLVWCAVVVLLGAAFAPLRADAAAGARPSFFSRIGQWFRNTIVRVFVRPASPPAPVAPPTPSLSAPLAPTPALPEGWTFDRSPLRIPAGTPAAEREAIERAYRILGGVPKDPRGTYNPNVGPLGQPIPNLNRSREEAQALDAATDATIKRGLEMFRSRTAPPR